MNSMKHIVNLDNFFESAVKRDEGQALTRPVHALAGYVRLRNRTCKRVSESDSDKPNRLCRSQKERNVSPPERK